MKILYDHSCFWENFGGVSRYFVELLKRLPESETELSLKFTNNEYIGELPRFHTRPFLPGLDFRGKARLIAEVGKIFSKRRIKAGGFDIYHPTHYDCFGMGILPRGVKKVATIHDMNYFAIPEFYAPGNRNKANQEKMGRLVDHIITVSRKSKEDIVKFWNYDPDRISVIYHGIDSDWIRNAPDIPYPEPYFLFVGRRNSYKNFDAVLKAFSSVRESEKELRLFVAGMPPTASELEKIRRLGLDGAVRFIRASSVELANLYRQAIAFIFPSYYEGFGLPILEAMAARCPVIVSDRSCFPEIAADAALYFNPDDPGQLADQMVCIGHNSDLQSRMTAKGLERAAQFSWDSSARMHREVYCKILGN